MRSDDPPANAEPLTKTPAALRDEANNLEAQARQLRQRADAADRRAEVAAVYVIADNWGPKLLATHPACPGDGKGRGRNLDPTKPASIDIVTEQVGAIHTDSTWDDGYPVASWRLAAVCTCGKVLTIDVPTKEMPMADLMRRLLAVPDQFLRRHGGFS